MLGCYKLARQAYDLLHRMRIPQKLQQLIDIGTITARTLQKGILGRNCLSAPLQTISRQRGSPTELLPLRQGKFDSVGITTDGE